MSNPLILIVTSNLKYGDSNSEDQKIWHVPHIKTLIDSNIASMIIVPGNLTNNGYDGKVSNKYCNKKAGSDENQLRLLQNKFVSQLSEDCPVLLCHGHNDMQNGANRYPVLDYIKSRHKNTIYTIEVKTKCTFLSTIFIHCLGLYPNKNTLKWLKQELGDRKFVPRILFFNYNLMDSKWSEKEKEKFYKTILEYNVVLILTNHADSHGQTLWNNIPVVYAADNHFAVVKYYEVINDDPVYRTGSTINIKNIGNNHVYGKLIVNFMS
jgi:hypothetical protein